MKLKNELLIIEIDNGSMDQYLIDSVQTLCFDTYKRFKARCNRLHEHKCRHVSESEIEVQSVRHTTAPARVLSKDTNYGSHACRNCKASVAYEEQCENELISNEHAFQKCLFS